VAGFNILAVVQAGRLSYEALLLAASLRASAPGFAGRLFLAEPGGPRWGGADPRLKDEAIRAALLAMGAEFLPFENRVFGPGYPHGNKIEALLALPDEPFLFLDTDTLVTGDLAAVPFDFARPSASMRREGTWPQVPLYSSHEAIWGGLYARFGLEMAPTLDLSEPADYWRRFLYFNAGWFFHDSPQAFGRRFLEIARSIRDDTPPELAAQELFPWLDQIALPLAVASFGGGRPGPELAGMDGDVTCHYRSLPLLYARESDRAVEVLEAAALRRDLRPLLRAHEPVRELVYKNRGRKIREMFDRADLPRREQAIRSRLKAEGLWLR
jgi:hypothetical protein